MATEGLITEGSVSCATLKVDDLLGAFADELERVGTDDDIALCIEARLFVELWEEGLTDEGRELSEEWLESLADRLGELAPEGLCFGAHEGDGADFGWWPVEDRCDCEPSAEGGVA